MLLAESFGCSGCTCLTSNGQSSSNFVAVLDEETETLACWDSFYSGFLGERSNVPPISLSFSSVNTRCLFIFLSITELVVLNLLTK
jgi:hypothetical protein